MQIPLCMVAKVTKLSRFPVVRLPEGAWTITSNHQKSQLRLVFTDGSNPAPLVNGLSFQSALPFEVILSVVESHPEDPPLTIIARLDGPYTSATSG
jgi:hypothetical protein